MEQAIDQDAATSMMPGETKKRNTGLMAGMICCAILAIGGIGFGVYGMMKANSSADVANLKVQIEDNNGKTTLLETDKIKVSDDSQTITISDSDSAYAIRDLKNKTLRLLGSRNGLSVLDYDNQNGFVVSSSYMPITELLSNSLDDSLKAYITLETTVLDKGKYCSYQWNNDVKADIDTILDQAGANFSFGANGVDCISYKRADEDHDDLWGEELPKINAVSTKTMFGDFAYGSNTDNYYYHVIGGRGGTCSDFVVGKIAGIDRDQDYAYVNINAGSLGVCAGNDGTLTSGIRSEETYKTISQDSIEKGELGLTEEDYNSLQFYRFTFKKNPSGIYSFSGIEEVKQ
ncbi:MAG: hypothetical protein Q4A70_03660 [Candidatus Saccharibacteria bacterium]|nr:hypothetical protein [Candidatus Saccharibacteria bacterium]